MSENAEPESTPGPAEESAERPRRRAPRKRAAAAPQGDAASSLEAPAASAPGDAAASAPASTSAPEVPQASAAPADGAQTLPPAASTDAASPAPQGVPADGTAPQPVANAEGRGEGRSRRRQRRGRKGREGRGEGQGEGLPQLQGQGQAAPRDRAPAPQHRLPDRKVEVDPQALAQAGAAFELVMSDGYDEDVTPTDEELRALEERAQRSADADDASAQAAAGAASDGPPSASPDQRDASVEAAPADGDAAAVSDDARTAEPEDPGATAAADAGPAGRPRRVLAPHGDAPKLQKVLAQSGAGSRRDIEQWITEGRVTVNGQTAHTGQRVAQGDRVAVDGKPVRLRIAPLPTRVIAYHKPVGEIVTHDDPQQRPTVFRKLPRLAHGKWQSVGRLDINTEGLLLFTNSGELANQLMHPRFGVEREYAVRVLGELGDAARARLLEGVDLDGQRAQFSKVGQGSGEGVNRWHRVTIAEGRHREVRRLFDAVGLAVSRLIRIRYGAVVLPKGLKRGVWVDLSEGDVKALKRLVGIGDRQPRDDDGRDQRGDRRGGNNNKRGRQGNPQGFAGPPGPGAQDRPPPRGGERDRDRGPRRGGRGKDRPPQQQHHQQQQHQQQRPQQGPRGEGGPIPNPLQQTFDKRAMRESQRSQRPVSDDDVDGPIPNPLQQTYDTRALRESNRVPKREYGEDGPIPNPLQQNFDKRQLQGHGDAFVIGGKRGGKGPRGPDGAGQPDPMQTAVGYIGADAFHTKMARGRGKSRGKR